MLVRFRQAMKCVAAIYLMGLSGCISSEDSQSSPEKGLPKYTLLESPLGLIALEVSEGGFLGAALQAVPPEAPSAFTYPVDFISADIGGLHPGAVVTLTVALPADVEPDLYVACSAGQCQPFSGAILAGSTAVLTLVDGGTEDTDGVADGVIRGFGAPAASLPRENQDGEWVRNEMTEVSRIVAEPDGLAEEEAGDAGEPDDGDEDSGNDGVPDMVDAFLPSRDTDSDRLVDDVDPDDDNDGVPDALDAFPADSAEARDTDGDGIGDNADTDDDGDGLPDQRDNCPEQQNADQLDGNGDGVGDACDPRSGLPDPSSIVGPRLPRVPIVVDLPGRPAWTDGLLPAGAP